MSFRYRWVALLLPIGTLVPAVAGAQTPWTVRVTPTMNPLAIGYCGAVRLDILDPAIRDTPRNPAGVRVSIADFDMSVTSTGQVVEVVGQQVDVSHWSVCACQAGTAGTVATITASYPARRLAPKEQVPGVVFQTTETVTLAAAKGGVNPPGCVGPPPVTVAGPAPVPLPPSPPSKTAGVTTAPTKTATTTPLTTAPLGTRGPTQPPSAAPPTGVTVTGPPLSPHLVWTAAPGATRYSVWRSVVGGVSVERSPAAHTATEFYEGVPNPLVAYRYTVFAHYADGTSGAAPAVTFTSGPLVNPTGFTVTPKTMGFVTFDWKPVPGAVRYRLDGPGLPPAGHHQTGTTVTYPKIPSGAGSWRVSALYYGNNADYANATVASAVVHVLPPHSQRWLTKNGPASAATLQMPKNTFSACWMYFAPAELDTAYSLTAARWLGEKACATAGEGFPNRIGLQRWLNFDTPLWGDPAEFGNEAVYGNALDLGVGRRAQCTQGFQPVYPGKPNRGLVTTCYATAHGIVPGQPGFNDLNAITHPGEGIGDDFILSMVITKDTTGTTFLVFVRDDALPYGRLAQQVSLDTEGPKFLPQACMACHGGTYNSVTRKVDGASFLPLDPSLLVFASPADQAAQEEKMRKVNHQITVSAPTSAVGMYIRGLYGNMATLSQPGARATPDYVPQGWTPQASFYRMVVKPHCAMCHLAANPSWNFASWQNFKDNGPLIRASVCSAHTMPHSELQFKSFWTKDTGVIHMPSLLATMLGFPTCQ